MQQLVADGDVPAILARVSQDEIARQWVRYADDPNAADSWWAVELWLSPEWWADRKRVRDGLLALVNAADSADRLSAVAAGPLESFISTDAGDVAWLERQARRDPRFRTALAGVWVWDLPQNIFDRLNDAVGGTLTRPQDGPHEPGA